MLALTEREISFIDDMLEPKLEWAKTRNAEAEQLALDCTRLLSCTEDRLGQIKHQGFFTRCWDSFSGKTGEMERANTADLISIQKAGLRYINLLQERQLMMAHSMLTLKNNLVTLAVYEEETRELIDTLAKRTLQRFQALESRVDQLEISQNLQGWLLGLEDRDYEDIYPTPYMRMFRVINDFYTYKNDNWNYNDILFMKKALRTVGLNPKEQISMNVFIDRIVDEIKDQGFQQYSELVMNCAPAGLDNFGAFAVENISSQVFTTVHGLHTQYTDKADVIEELSEELSITPDAALKRLLGRYITKLNVDLDCALPLSDIAIEMLGGLRLSAALAAIEAAPDTPESVALESVQAISIPSRKDTSAPAKKKEKSKFIDVNKLGKPRWIIQELPEGCRPVDITEVDGTCYLVNMPSDDNVKEYEDGVSFETSVFETKDFINFTKSTKKYAPKVERINGMSLIGTCFYSESEERVRKLPLPQNYDGRTIEYKKILFDNGKWFAFGTYYVSHEYTVPGIIFDSTESSPCIYGVIYTSGDLQAWNLLYSTREDFGRYDVLSLAINNGRFVLLLKYFTGGDPFIVFSPDGQKWSKAISNLSWSAKNLFFIDDKFIAVGYSMAYSSKDGCAWKNEERDFYMSDYCEMSHALSHKWRFYKDECLFINFDRKLYVTNNCLDWVEIDNIFNDARAELYFVCGCFVLYLENKIAVWKLE